MTLSPSAISYPTTPTIPLTWFIKDDMQGNNNMQQLTTRLGYKPQLGHARLVVELAIILHEDKAYISVICIIFLFLPSVVYIDSNICMQVAT